jgi:hypothetical protein
MLRLARLISAAKIRPPGVRAPTRTRGQSLKTSRTGFASNSKLLLLIGKPHIYLAFRPYFCPFGSPLALYRGSFFLGPDVGSRGLAEGYPIGIQRPVGLKLSFGYGLL